MAYVILNLVCVAALVGIDQAIKLWATQYLAPVEAITVIPHVVELRFVLNQGMAFSLLSGKQLFLILATSAALLLVAYWLFFRSRGKYLQQAALILVLGGGIGNLIDRVLNGEVVDYINVLFMRLCSPGSITSTAWCQVVVSGESGTSSSSGFLTRWKVCIWA